MEETGINQKENCSACESENTNSLYEQAQNFVKKRYGRPDISEECEHFSNSKNEHSNELAKIFLSHFGRRLKEAREVYGGLETQKELANLLNCSVAAITSYESGRRIPSLETTIAICIATNTNPFWLLGFEESKLYDEPGDSPVLIETGGMTEVYKRSLIDLIENSNSYFITMLHNFLLDKIMDNAHQRGLL